MSEKELKQKVIDILELEVDRSGQLVLKDYEDIRSNWKFSVDVLVSFIETQTTEAYKKGYIASALGN